MTHAFLSFASAIRWRQFLMRFWNGGEGFIVGELRAVVIFDLEE